VKLDRDDIAVLALPVSTPWGERPRLPGLEPGALDQLLRALAVGPAPDFAWVVEHAGDGADPVARAWREQDTPGSMALLVVALRGTEEAMKIAQFFVLPRIPAKQVEINHSFVAHRDGDALSAALAVLYLLNGLKRDRTAARIRLAVREPTLAEVLAAQEEP
jgi:hypothetical protein